MQLIRWAESAGRD